MDTCLEELQANTSLAGTDLKMEASITQQFDERIRRQLDPVWNHLKPMTKQVVADLKTLRLLLDYLLRYGLGLVTSPRQLLMVGPLVMQI